MEPWLLLIILGLFAYFLLIKGRTKQLTRTPAWLLWLAMMLPPVTWVSWTTLLDRGPPPLELFLATLLAGVVLYWGLIQVGRPTAKTQPSEGAEPQKTSPTPPPQGDDANAKLRPITETEESELRNCFPWGVYFLQHIDYRPQAILCRGKLRAVPEVAYNTVKDNIEEVFGDRFLVVFQESFRGQPFFAVVPNPWANKAQTDVPEKLFRPGLAFGLLLINLVTTTWMGAHFSGYSLEELQATPELILKGWPFSVALLTILGLHELGHYWAARSYRMRTTLPYFIPEPGLFLGTVGAFVQIRSPFPHRKALFDVAIAGPLAGLVLALPLLFWGLSLSETVPLPEETTSFLDFAQLDPRYSFLLALLSKLALGSALAPDTVIALHPLAIAGYIGLLVTALNLMPIGQLDGGHIVHAVFGQRTAVTIGQITRLLMFVLAFTRQEFLIWAIILLFLPISDQPALNDITELDNRRDLLGLFSLALLIVILLPLPQMIAQRLAF